MVHKARNPVTGKLDVLEAGVLRAKAGIWVAILRSKGRSPGFRVLELAALTRVMVLGWRRKAVSAEFGI